MNCHRCSLRYPCGVASCAALRAAREAAEAVQRRDGSTLDEVVQAVLQSAAPIIAANAPLRVSAGPVVGLSADREQES